MFKTKEEFSKRFVEKLAETYGVSVETSDISEQYQILGELVRDYAGYYWRETKSEVADKNKKQLIYFSLEFLLGKLMVSNMQNLGIFDICKDGLADLNIDINDLIEQEPDAGLGNGGLGRLAACFIDSLASLGYAGHGNTIRYDYGFFVQKFVDGKQTELPDPWLRNGNVWEVKKPKHSVEVQFYGRPEMYLAPNGEYAIRLVDALHITAMPYDMTVPGYKNNVANTLRLWSAEPSNDNLPTNMSFDEYLGEVKSICRSLYPDDSTEEGKLLRLKQEYFLCSAGLQSVTRSYFRKNKNFKNFEKSYVFQLNDTHPILCIPELMRILMDDYGYGWDYAWNIVTKSVAYTNHTILQEALEKWPVHYIQRLLPRIYQIIEEINRRYNLYMLEKGVSDGDRNQMMIIKDGQIHMANMAIYASFSVNGVAALHTEILKNSTFNSFYRFMPEKFNNKTNGITHRRWFMYSNPKLADLVTEKIGPDWINDPSKLKEFDKFADDKAVQDAVMRIKHENKKQFSSYILKNYGIDVSSNSIFDVQVKRLHAYKRQLLNILYVMYLYNRIKSDPNFAPAPTTFIYGAKAAPSYRFAKQVIELINAVGYYINNDPDVNKYIKVVFLENYCVSLSEKCIPAADVSEQISTAGYEASGTSNMKFMMNGAITLGTLDGANIEIVDLAGRENAVIFGLNSEEVSEFERNGTYNPWDLYNNDYEINEVINLLFNGPWADDNHDRFRGIFDELMGGNDQYFVLKDFRSYIDAHNRINELYADKRKWAKACIHNIANSGFFSSDRTIQQYVDDIWHLEKVK